MLLSNSSMKNEFKSQETLPLSKVKKSLANQKNPLANNPLN